MTQEASQLAASRAKRHATRHRGITYRETANGRSYSITVTDGNGKPSYVKAGRTEKEALTLWAEYQGRRGKGQKLVVPGKTTFAELAEQWLEGKTRLGAWTRRGYRDALDNLLLPYLGSWKIGAVDEDAIAKLVRGLEREGLHFVDRKRPVRPLSASAITNYLKPLSGTLALALRRNLIPSNPYRNLTSDERPRQAEPERAHEWSDEQIEQLLSASATVATKRDAKYDYTPLLRTAVFTGLRLGELLGLTWEHVDLDEGVIHVEQQWTLTHELTPPKTKAGIRRVPLSVEMVAFLRRHKLASKFSGESDFVFASLTGKALQHRNVQVRGFEAARDEAGLPETLSFHDLRHAFASMAAHRGVPVQIVSAVLGHRDIGVTTKVYVHLFSRQSTEDAFREAMSR